MNIRIYINIHVRAERENRRKRHRGIVNRLSTVLQRDFEGVCSFARDSRAIRWDIFLGARIYILYRRPMSTSGCESIRAPFVRETLWRRLTRRLFTVECYALTNFSLGAKRRDWGLIGHSPASSIRLCLRVSQGLWWPVIFFMTCGRFPIWLLFSPCRMGMCVLKSYEMVFFRVFHLMRKRSIYW